MIVNAICHRNYMDNSCVQVAIYDDRVEVTSPGILYGGLTLQEALSGRSKIRNQAIAEVFSRMEIVESWGTGIQRILKQAQEYGLPEPEFLEIGDTFRVNLFRKVDSLQEKADKKPIKADSLQEKADKKPIKADSLQEKADKKPIKADSLQEKADKKPIEADSLQEKADKKPIKADSLQEKADRENIILIYVRENVSISNEEARELLNLAESTTKRLLKSMVDDGLLIAQGKNKLRRYYIKES